MVEILFWFSVLVVFYVYAGYPILLKILSYRKTSIKTNDNYFPSVTLFIPAYNEETVIEEKLKNSLALEYPPDKFEILVASDGSDDGTEQVVENLLADPRISFFRRSDRGGKNSLINQFISSAKGEIMVFTDANAFFVSHAITKLVRHFADPQVGLVCGHLKYKKEINNNVGEGEGLYFRYESLIKRLESRWGAVAVVTGAIYAIRKSLFSPLDPDVANDFAHPVLVGAKGYKVVFEPDAIAYERTTSSISEEFKRRARIVTRGFTGFGRYWKSYRMLNGVRGFCFVSHKPLRWFVPFFLITLFMINLFLDAAIFRATLWAQISFYGAALCGLFIKGKYGKLFAIPFYFCMINLAALIGFVNYLRGRRQAVWEVAKTTR